MFISNMCLTAILENLSILNKETEQLKKRIADLEGQVQGQQMNFTLKSSAQAFQEAIHNLNNQECPVSPELQVSLAQKVQPR